MATEIGRMQTVLEAETAAHDKALDASADKVSAVATRTAKETRSMAEAQNAAAKYGADGITTQGRRVQAAWKENAEAAKNFRDIQNGMKKGYIDAAAGLDGETRAIQRQIAARREMRDELSVTSGYTQQMAASGAVRFMSGGSGGIRSVERFIDLSPRVAQAVSSIFPWIGAAGLAGMLVDMGEKGYDAFEKVIHGAELTAQAFAGLHDKAKVESDDLDIENQKIQDQIDKLSGHPNNGLYSALLADRKMADQLVLSLNNADTTLQNLLKQDSPGAWGTLMNLMGIGPASTSVQAGQLTSDAGGLTKAIQSANDAYDDTQALTSDPKALQAATEKRNIAVKAAFQSQIDGLVTEGGRLRKEQDDSVKAAASWVQPKIVPVGMHPHPPEPIDNSNKIKNVSGRIQQLKDLMHDELAAESIKARNVVLGQMRQDKFGTGSKDNAQERQMKAMNDAEAKLKLGFKDNHDAMVTEQLNFWEGMLRPAAKYPDNLKTVQDKVASLTQTFNATISAIDKQAVAEQKADMAANLRAKAELADQLTVLQRIDDQYAEALHHDQNALGALQGAIRKNADALREQALAHGIATGAITEHIAAMQTAAIHAGIYAAALAQIKAERENNKNDTSMSPEARKTANDALDVKQATLGGSAALQGAQDQWTIFQTSALGGATGALQKFTAAANNLSGELEHTVTTTLEGLNKNLLAMMTNPAWKNKGQWKDYGKGIFTDVAGSALKRGEAGIMGAFGVGKLGTRSNPMIVRNVDGAAAAAASPLATLGRSLFGPRSSAPSMVPAGQSGLSGAGDLASMGKSLFGPNGPATPNVASSGSGAATSGFISMLTHLIPGFADGGSVAPGTTAWVGEQGPELVHFGSAAHLTANRNLPTGGDTHHYHIAVDARAATNPAEVEAAGYRGAMRAAPQIAAAATRHIQSERERTPASLRRP